MLIAEGFILGKQVYRNDLAKNLSAFPQIDLIKEIYLGQQQIGNLVAT